MTRNEKRFRPGPKSVVPGTMATLSPPARQSASRVPGGAAVVDVFDSLSLVAPELPQPADVSTHAMAIRAAAGRIYARV
jgi:hypothetical protein